MGRTHITAAALGAALLLAADGAAAQAPRTPARDAAQGAAERRRTPLGAEPTRQVARTPTTPAEAYRQAQQLLDRGDYHGAIAAFGRVVGQFAHSSYAPDAMYWQAWAYYRLGGAPNLVLAREVLRAQARKYPGAAERGDAPALRARIAGALARGGDEGAAVEVAELAEGGPKDPARKKYKSREKAMDRDIEKEVGRAEKADTKLDGKADKASRKNDKSDKTGRDGATLEEAIGRVRQCEGDDMRLEAINALMQMDADRALPILRDVLAKRDACSLPLRRKAVFVLSQNKEREATELLLATARTDPDAEVRREAVRWLGDADDPRAVAVLDSILRRGDEGMRESALFALANNGGTRGHEVLRRYAQDPATPTAGLRRAVFALGHFGGAPEDAEFLKGLYTRTPSIEVKRDIIQSVAQVDRRENGAWILGIAADAREEVEVRKHALFWAQQAGVATAELVGVFPRLGADRDLRQHWVFVLSQRDDRAALDRLIEIAKTDPDRELRRRAIFWLGQKDDPRAQQALLEIIEK